MAGRGLCGGPRGLLQLRRWGQDWDAGQQPDVRWLSDVLRSTAPPTLVCHAPPAAAQLAVRAPSPGAFPFYCTCYSLCHRWAPERDLHVQSFASVCQEKVSLCLLLTCRGGQQKTLLEAPRSALPHLDQLLADQVARGFSLMARSPVPPRRATLCSPLESIAGAVTTVEAQRGDDITEGTWRQGGPSEDPALSDQGLLAGHLMAFQAGGSVGAARGPEKSGPDMEEHLAVMYERLRHELPNIFLKRHDYSLYSPDVEFQNGLLHVTTRGRPMYQAALTFCRFLAWNYFADIHMEVLKLTQHPENWSVQARWRLTGLPFHVLMYRFYRRDKSDLYRVYDAYSTFYLGSDGLIHRHKLDKLMPAQPPALKTKRLLAGLLVALGLSEDRPALNLFFSQIFRAGQKQC